MRELANWMVLKLGQWINYIETFYSWEGVCRSLIVKDYRIIVIIGGGTPARTDTRVPPPTPLYTIIYIFYIYI